MGLIHFPSVVLLLTAFGVAGAQTCTPITPDANDGVILATKAHKVIYEDQDVRVMDVTSPPHSMEVMHTHARPSLFIVLQDAPYTIHFPDGKSFQPPVGKPPYIVPMGPNPMHAIENAGDSTLRAIRVEFKHPGCGPAPAQFDAHDSVVSDAAHEKVAFESADVRVVEVSLPPHAREAMHTDTLPAVLFADQPAQILDVLEMGSKPPVQALGPAVMRTAPRSMHAVENLSDTPLHFYRVELKRALPKS